MVVPKLNLLVGQPSYLISHPIRMIRSRDFLFHFALYERSSQKAPNWSDAAPIPTLGCFLAGWLQGFRTSLLLCWMVVGCWWGCIKNHNACSQHWSTESANSSLKQCPITRHTANASKTEWIWLRSFASPGTFTWPLANWLPLLKASQQLLQGKCFHNQQEGENASQEFVESRDTDFYATGITNLISLAKMYWL